MASDHSAGRTLPEGVHSPNLQQLFSKSRHTYHSHKPCDSSNPTILVELGPTIFRALASLHPHVSAACSALLPLAHLGALGAPIAAWYTIVMCSQASAFLLGSFEGEEPYFEHLKMVPGPEDSEGLQASATSLPCSLPCFVLRWVVEVAPRLALLTSVRCSPEHEGMHGPLQRAPFARPQR